MDELRPWKYGFVGEDGKPGRGTILAIDRQDAEKRLRSMAIPRATLDEKEAQTTSVQSVQEPVSHVQREPPPQLTSNPVMVLDEITKSAQVMMERHECKTELDNATERRKNCRRTRERIFFGEPEKIISVADKLLAERNGTVLHFSTAIDPKGKFLVAIVVRHEVEENESKI